MPTSNAAGVVQLAIKMGLINTTQVQQCREEAGNDAAAVLRALERKSFLTPWQIQKLGKGDTDGYFLGGYRLLYKIASGSFGRVFRGDNPRTGEIVAIKVLRRRWSENPHSIELFEREGKVGLSLKHPNIVSILAVSKDPVTQQYYIVMEFVEGGNLREILAIRKKLEPAEALRLLEDAAAGLAYAYSKGVTHRDMKLTNVLIASQGTAKLVDFGLAGMFSTQGLAGKDEEEHIDRTVDYAGLEKATGVEQADVRSDIYFLGCVLYEMLTGRSPLLMSRDKYQRMQKERFTSVKPIGRDEIAAPPLVFHLVETMMAFNPKQRYQTPAQLLEAIREARAAVTAFGGADGKDNNQPAGPVERSVFIVERDEKLKDVLREKLKELGYRVFISADPLFAQNRFRQKPFDCIIVDAGTVGEEGVTIFQQILLEAEQMKLVCVGILVLSKTQGDIAERIMAPRATVMIRPITLGQLYRTLTQLVPVAKKKAQA